jgi:SecD/SecF fusion protein
MKTNYIIGAIIIAVFSYVGCTAQSSYDLKVTVVPQTFNHVTTINDMNKAAEVINKRLKYFFGIPQESIKLDVIENQILLVLGKIDTGKIDRIKDVITGYDKLEFWETYENGEIIGYLSKANNILRDIQLNTVTADKIDTNISEVPDSIVKKEAKSLSDIHKKNIISLPKAATKEFVKQNPLFGILRPMVTDNGEPLPSCMIGLASGKDTSETRKYLTMDQVKAIFPHNLKFYWGANPYKYDPSNTLYGLHTIKVTTSSKQAPIDGSVITSAKLAAGSPDSGLKIDLTMDSEGASTWAKITRENINRCIAVVYEGHVRSYPRVMNEISGGSTEITGDFTVEEATNLVNILKSGELPFELKIVKEQIIKKE